jgi:cytochrome c oxidase subunit 1
MMLLDRSWAPASSCRRSSRWAAAEVWRRQPDPVPAPVLVLRPSRGLHRRLPAFGIVSDLISTHARKNIFGYRMMVWAIVGIGALSFVVWAHHMYVSGMNPYFGFFFATTTLIIAIPTAIKVYNWVLTLWRGDIHLTVPMLFALAFIVTFVNGGLTGLFLGNVVVDVPLSDTMFVVAHFHMVMGVAPIWCLRGDLSLVPEDHRADAGRDAGQVPLLGHVPRRLRDLLPDALSGLLGVPRRYHDIGAWRSSRIGPDAERLHQRGGVDRRLRPDGVPVQSHLEPVQGQGVGGNPWRATTLEWQTPETPPGHGNWGKELPVVYRWAYDYSVPGAAQDFIPQNEPRRDAAGSGSAP